MDKGVTLEGEKRMEGLREERRVPRREVVGEEEAGGRGWKEGERK